MLCLSHPLFHQNQIFLVVFLGIFTMVWSAIMERQPIKQEPGGPQTPPRQWTPNGPHWTVLHLLHNSVLLLFLLVTLSQNPQLKVLTSFVLVWFIYQLLPLIYFLASRRRDFYGYNSAGIALTIPSSCHWDWDLLLSISTRVGKLRVHFHLCCFLKCHYLWMFQK